MSYLLTEIALEMLGYKFYDIYGVQDEINNFQNLAASDRSANANELSEEPTLATLLGLSSSATDSRNYKRSQTNEFGKRIRINLPESITKLMDTEYSKVRQQLMRNKQSLPVADNQLEPRVVQVMMKNLVESEHEKLLVEQQNLQSFRKLVEESLMHVNPASFEKYIEVFRGTKNSSNTESTKK